MNVNPSLSETQAWGVPQMVYSCLNDNKPLMRLLQTENLARLFVMEVR